ncbi:MAG TPA: hypothetical protein VGF94_05270 [Kofleriaceae bacterium]|jgi:hypothetical protein
MRWVVACLIVVAGCKGDPVKCEQACRNYAQLVFWKRADAEIGAAPAARRDELREQKAAKFAADLEAGVDMCSSKCISANNDTQMSCLIAAKTADQAMECTKD